MRTKDEMEQHISDLRYILKCARASIPFTEINECVLSEIDTVLEETAPVISVQDGEEIKEIMSTSELRLVTHPVPVIDKRVIARSFAEKLLALLRGELEEWRVTEQLSSFLLRVNYNSPMFEPLFRSIPNEQRVSVKVPSIVVEGFILKDAHVLHVEYSDEDVVYFQCKCTSIGKAPYEPFDWSRFTSLSVAQQLDVYGRVINADVK